MRIEAPCQCALTLAAGKAIFTTASCSSRERHQQTAAARRSQSDLTASLNQPTTRCITELCECLLSGHFHHDMWSCRSNPLSKCLEYVLTNLATLSFHSDPLSRSPAFVLPHHGRWSSRICLSAKNLASVRENRGRSFSRTCPSASIPAFFPKNPAMSSCRTDPLKNCTVLVQQHHAKLSFHSHRSGRIPASDRGSHGMSFCRSCRSSQSVGCGPARPCKRSFRFHRS